MSLECASNVVHFRLCEDSCVALCDLLHYISSQHDLTPPPPAFTTTDYSSMPTSLPPPPSSLPPTPLGAGSGSSTGDLAEGGVTADIGDLISDAMEESPPVVAAATAGVGGGAGVRQVSSRAPKLVEVQVSGESLLMDFDSDSDTEESRLGVSKPRPVPTPTAPSVTGRGKVEHDGLFSDSDDDFCIVNTPTSTRVVSLRRWGGGVASGSPDVAVQAPGAKPKVKCLLEEGEELMVVDDHFTIPVRECV